MVDSSDVPAADPPESPRPWPLLESTPAEDMILFQPRWDLMENPRTGRSMRRLVLETRDWVNVLARTEEGQFVVVRQYRFGTRHVTTEIPGGVIDPGEEPLAAAQRELREETGYTAERWSCLGRVEPNPAFHDNLCHHYLAEDARLTHPQEQDPGEDIVVATLSGVELTQAIHEGQIDHALVISAVCRVLDLRRPLDGP